MINIQKSDKLYIFGNETEQQIQMALFIINMITQQVVRKAAGEQDNQRVYKVDLCSRSINRITGLKPFGKIRCLHLGFNRIKNIENLECLPDLRELHLEYNQIGQLTGLDNNKMLTVLTLSSNKIQKIQNIGHLIKLQTLVIDNNRIQKISGLQTLKDLKYISLSGNKLTSIDSLPSFSKLQTLIADKNSIRTIQPTIFAKSTKLIKLSLSHNEIEDVSFVNSLASLQQLNISQNRIVDINIGPLKNLEYLNVSNNKIGRLPRVSVCFPELSVFLFGNNQIISQFQLIQSFAQAQMLVQIDYRGNLINNPNFSDTLHKVYGFDRINDKNYNKPGTKYINQAQQIRKVLHEEGLGQIQNDDDVRKIIMSGFYNDDLQADMTGVKPDRPSSASKNKSNINYEDLEKSYHEIVKNQKRLQYLRNTCLHIFESYGIKVNIPGFKLEQAEQTNIEQSNSDMLTEPKNLADKTTSINTIEQFNSKNQENINKWKQLKNREKSFNIRGVVRKMSGSQRKSGTGIKEGSISKIPSVQQRSQLMKTQLQPPRWNNDPNLMRTMHARPLSSSKKK